MTDKNININAKIETSAMISGIKQMTDELKRFASEAQRSGNLIGNVFKSQSSEIQKTAKQFDFLANSVKNSTQALASSSSQAIKIIQQDFSKFQKQLESSPLTKKLYEDLNKNKDLIKLFGNDFIKSMDDLKFAKQTLKDITNLRLESEKTKIAVKNLVDTLNAPQTKSQSWFNQQLGVNKPSFFNKTAFNQYESHLKEVINSSVKRASGESVPDAIARSVGADKSGTNELNKQLSWQEAIAKEKLKKIKNTVDSFIDDLNKYGSNKTSFKSALDALVPNKSESLKQLENSLSWQEAITKAKIQKTVDNVKEFIANLNKGSTLNLASIIDKNVNKGSTFPFTKSAFTQHVKAFTDLQNEVNKMIKPASGESISDVVNKQIKPINSTAFEESLKRLPSFVREQYEDLKSAYKDINSLADLKAAKLDMLQKQGKLNELLKVQLPRDQKINIDTTTFKAADADAEKLKNKLKELFNLPQGKSFLAGIAGGATVTALNSVGQAIQQLTDKVIRFGDESIKMSITYDRLTNRFNAASGGIKSGTESWIFMKNLANEMGVSFVETSDSFGTFEAAALRSGLSMEQTQQVFSDISAATVSLQLDSYRTGLSFMALSQMASKGTVQMEELKRQLGESLPGAVQIGARAMGMTNAQFHKMVEEGKILSSDFLPKFAAQVKKDLGGSLAIASQQARAEFNRITNATNDLKDALGDLINLALVPLAKHLTPILSQMARSIGTFAEIEKVTGNFKSTIQGISNALGTGGLILILGLVIANFGRLCQALKAVAGLFVTAGAAINLNPYIRLATIIVTILVGAFEALRRTKNREIAEAEKSVIAIINEKNEFNRLSNELNPVISKYEELRKKKNRTNDEQKTFLNLQEKIIEVFPDMKTVINKHGSVIAGLADMYKALNEDMLKSQLILEDAKIKSIEDTQKPLPAPVFGPGGVVTFSDTETLNPLPLSKEKQLELATAKRNAVALKLQLEMLKVDGIKTGSEHKEDGKEQYEAYKKLNEEILKNKEILEDSNKIDSILGQYVIPEAAAEKMKSLVLEFKDAERRIFESKASNKGDLINKNYDYYLKKAKTVLKEIDDITTEFRDKEFKENFEATEAEKERRIKVKREEEALIRENKLKALEIELSKELALTYMTEEEKLAKTVDVERARLDLYRKISDGTAESESRIAEQQNRVWEAQRAVIEEQLKYIKSLFSAIESSFKDSVAGILKGQSTLKDGFTSLMVGIKNAWMDMIAQMITDFMRMKIIDPIMKNMFNSMGGGITNTVQNTAKSVQALSSGIGAISAVAPVMATTLSVVQPPLISLTPIMNKAAESVAKFAVSSAAASVAIIPILGAVLAGPAAAITGGLIAAGIATAIAPMRFSKGGIVPGSFSQSMPAIVEGSEMILNPRQQANLFKMANNESPRNNKQPSGGVTVVNAPQITTGAKKEDVLSALKESNKELAKIITGIIQGNTGGQIRQVIRSV